MAATKNVASPAAVLVVLLPLVMLLRPPTALAARHLPVTTSHQSLINLTPSPFRRAPVVSHPTPPPPPHTAVDNEEFPVLRKVPRGPGHSPNDPSPPPPRSAATTTVKLSLVPATEEAARHLPVTTSHIALIPPSGHGRPVISHPPPPPPTSAAEDDDEFSVLRKVPRGPGHSPNDPSPPPPLLLDTEQEVAAASEHPAALYFAPIHAPEPPPTARKQE